MTKLKTNKNGECLCPDCGSTLILQWENVGFQEPDPSKYEITGYICPNCGYKEN